jgi:hypothetical protein
LPSTKIVPDGACWKIALTCTSITDLAVRRIYNLAPDEGRQIILSSMAGFSGGPQLSQF